MAAPPIDAVDDAHIFRWYDWPGWYGTASLIPGLGQTLGGRPLDGLTAVLMTGLPGTAAYFAHRQGEKVLAVSAAALSTLFYLGNISYAIQLVHERNVRAQQIHREGLAERLFSQPRFKFSEDYLEVDWQPSPIGQGPN